MLHQTERLALKVLSDDKAALRRMATLDGEAMSVVVRRLIRQEAQRRGLRGLADPQTSGDSVEVHHDSGQ